MIINETVTFMGGGCLRWHLRSDGHNLWLYVRKDTENTWFCVAEVTSQGIVPIEGVPDDIGLTVDEDGYFKIVTACKENDKGQ